MDDNNLKAQNANITSSGQQDLKESHVGGSNDSGSEGQGGGDFGRADDVQDIQAGGPGADAQQSVQSTQHAVNGLQNTISGQVSDPRGQVAHLQTNQPQQTVSAPNKEVAPPVQQSVEHHVRPTEQHVELSPELQEVGVEQSPDLERPELSPEVQKAGVEHAKEHAVVDPVKPPVIQLPPYKREEVLPHAKHGSVSDAATWFYTFLLRQIDKVKKQNLSQK
jgi:hypothetical protein